MATSTSTGERAVLGDRKAQALRDLVDVERQLAEGEIDEATAERLTRIYEAEVIRAVEAMEALDRSDREARAADARAGAGGRRWSRRRVVWGTAIMLAACGLVVFAVTQAIKPRPPGEFVTGGVAAPGDGDVDLSKVTNEQMEEVVAQNPGVVRMRLALARRYIQSQDFEKARQHAHIALQQEPGDANRQEALWILGWSTVMTGDPPAGAALLQQSLDLDEDDPNALFYLGVTRLEVLNDPAGAVPLFERVLAKSGEQMTSEERQVVEQALAAARAGASSPSTTAPATTAPPGPVAP